MALRTSQESGRWNVYDDNDNPLNRLGFDTMHEANRFATDICEALSHYSIFPNVVGRYRVKHDESGLVGGEYYTLGAAEDAVRILSMPVDKRKFKVLVVDQFSGLTPYWLSQNSTQFEALCASVMSETTAHGAFNPPKVLEVDETFRTPFTTTCFRADVDGNAEIWQYRWDSSG